MSSYDAPAYFCVTGDFAASPDADSCTEGRVFVDDRELLCGAGEVSARDGYVSRADAHAGSTVRRLVGSIRSFQDFDAREARTREETVSLPFEAVAGVDVLEWEGSTLGGADGTYGVRVASPNLPGGSLLVQLGRGWRNRGSGRDRHVALAQLLRARTGTGSTQQTGSHSRPGATQQTGSHSRPGPTAPEPGPDSHETDEGGPTPSNATTPSNTDAEWLTGDGQTALVARNDTQQTVSARIGCRTNGDTRFVDDVTLGSRERKRWTDLPRDESFEVGVALDDGERTLAEFDGASHVDGDIHVYLAPGDVDIGTSTASSAVSTTTPPQDGTVPDRSTSTDDSSTTSTLAARIPGAKITVAGLVLWFGSPALDQLQAPAAVVGAAITFYGLYRFVRAK